MSLAILLMSSHCSGDQSYQIITTWDSSSISHMDRPVEITMDRHDANSFSIVVNAPFFSDPSPPGPPGQAFYGLWDYEGIGIFNTLIKDI